MSSECSRGCGKARDMLEMESSQQYGSQFPQCSPWITSKPCSGFPSAFVSRFLFHRTGVRALCIHAQCLTEAVGSPWTKAPTSPTQGTAEPCTKLVAPWGEQISAQAQRAQAEEETLSKGEAKGIMAEGGEKEEIKVCSRCQAWGEDIGHGKWREERCCFNFYLPSFHYPNR